METSMARVTHGDNLQRIMEDEAMGGAPLHTYRGSPLRWTQAEKESWMKRVKQ